MRDLVSFMILYGSTMSCFYGVCPLLFSFRCMNWVIIKNWHAVLTSSFQLDEICEAKLFDFGIGDYPAG